MKYLNESDSEAYTKKVKRKKEIFYQILKIIKKHYKRNMNLEFLDIGCADGNLINFLSEEYINSKFYGIDVAKNLIKNNINTNNKKFFVNDYKKLNKKNKYDVVMAIGVAGYVDNTTVLIKDLLKFVKKGGFLILEGGINFNGYDVHIRFRHHKSKKSNWETGFNSTSSKYVESYLKKNKLHFKYFNWDFPISIRYSNKDSKIRNRTMKDENGKFWIFNGLNYITHAPKTNYLNPTSSLMVIYKN